MHSMATLPGRHRSGRFQSLMMSACPHRLVVLPGFPPAGPSCSGLLTDWGWVQIPSLRTRQAPR